MDYQEALAWIHGKLRFGIKPGLERMAWMLQELGNPQEKVAAVHVVGTNGKGSVTSYLQHIFSLASYEVGTFTSPYILDFRERISLNGQMISQPYFLEHKCFVIYWHYVFPLMIEFYYSLVLWLL